jgi:hypothetical protein
MIDESIPVLIRLAIGNEQSFCVAILSREDGQLIALPSIIASTFSRVRDSA